MKNSNGARTGRPAARRMRLAEFIPYRVVTLGHRMSGALSSVYRDEGISVPEWRVLAVVGQEDEMAARDVAALTPMDKMAVSRAIASLEEKRLVVRRLDARDRRVYSLRLSEEGRALYDRAMGLAVAFEGRLLGALDPRELAAFRATLSRLEECLEAGRA